MIYSESIVHVADNSGAKTGKCIKVLTPISTKGYKVAKVGDIIMVSLQKVLPDRKVKKSGKYKALIVSTKQYIKRAIGTIIFKDGKVANINYVPSVKNPRFNEAIMRNEKIERRRALIATAARYGKYRLDGDATDIRNAASYLRYEKAFDPTLGLYAAYAYAQAGDTEGILSVYKYMSEEPEPVLLDVTLLARFSGNKNSFNRPYAPFFPLLTQGWSYLAIEPNFPPEIVRELARHLSPGLWTTFTSEAKEILMKLHNR